MSHFKGVKTYSDPSYIFSWGQDPTTPMIYAPVHNIKRTRRCTQQQMIQQQQQWLING